MVVGKNMVVVPDIDGKFAVLSLFVAVLMQCLLPYQTVIFVGLHVFDDVCFSFLLISLMVRFSECKYLSSRSMITYWNALGLFSTTMNWSTSSWFSVTEILFMTNLSSFVWNFVVNASIYSYITKNKLHHNKLTSLLNISQ